MTSQTMIERFIYTIGSAGGVEKTEQIHSTMLLEEGQEIRFWSDPSLIQLHSVIIRAISHSMVNSEQKKTPENFSKKLSSIPFQWDIE